MIVKEVIQPKRILQLQALLNRLPDELPDQSRIKEDLIKLQAGFKGERAASYYLNFLPEKEYYIFHSLRLPSGRHHFQIDYLLLTPSFAVIIECKNFYGKLFFEDSFQQLIRTANNQEEGFQNPLAQVKWHQNQLQSWLKLHHFPSFPIEYLVMISNPSTIITARPDDKQALSKVIHSHSLLEKIAEMSSLYKEEALEKKTLRKLIKLLLKSHTTEVFEPLKCYELEEKNIVTGVRCPVCTYLPMIRKNRTWYCPDCKAKDKHAHIPAVYDYFYLVNKTITNKQFRNFVHLSSESTARKMLTALNLPVTGENKGRIYHKPSE